MNKFILSCIVIVLLVVVLLGIGYAQFSYSEEVYLTAGRHANITFNQSFYVASLVELNPVIEYVSYYDPFLNRSVQYVNVFGGIGQNFLITPGRLYEISVRTNTTIRY